MIYQEMNFKICLSLFGCKEMILPKKHIVQCISKSRKFLLVGTLGVKTKRQKDEKAERRKDRKMKRQKDKKTDRRKDNRQKPKNMI